jgi:hypothetical protein
MRWKAMCYFVKFIKVPSSFKKRWHTGIAFAKEPIAGPPYPVYFLDAMYLFIALLPVDSDSTQNNYN